MSDWGNKIEVKKGAIGETLVKEYLEKKGFILYKPVTDGSHKIDFFAHSGKEKKIICCEVKTKRRRAKYTDTGFDVRSYEQYMEIYYKHNIDTFVFFVDDFEECVYGQWLSLLGDGKIINGKSNVIVWELSKMKRIKNLEKNVVLELKRYTKENYDYRNVKKYFT